LADVSEVFIVCIIRAMSLALMMEAVSTSETSVNFYETMRRNISAVMFILYAVRT
jgi:hypothetical protein